MSQPDPMLEPDFDGILDSRRAAARYDLGKRPWMISTAEHLLTILRSPLRVTILNLLSELATLITLADARTGDDPRHQRSTADPPIPSFKSVWAEKRLDQVNARLWAEAESVAAFNNRPHDPDLRRGVCDTCGNPYAKEDICCRWCGRQLHQIDQIGSG